MKILALIFITIGIMLLTLSMIPLRKMCDKDRSGGWNAILGLVGFFIAGYLASLFYLYLEPALTIGDVVFTIILLSGSMFVLTVAKFSLSSANTIERINAETLHNSAHDSLTSLPNRHNFDRQCTALIHKLIPFQLMLIDLNNFKQINDALGHHNGDKLLSNLAVSLTTLLPKPCTVFRMGGDEFAIVWPRSSNISIGTVHQQVQQALITPTDLEGYKLSVSASIGLSSYPEHSTSSQELLRQADTAMYCAKRQKAPYMIYSDAWQHNARENLAIAAKLNPALNNNQFELYYQPIVDTKTQQLHGAEVLLRWPQTDGSFISPEKFIPIAEQSTVINQLSIWVVEQAIAALHQLNAIGFGGQLHVNLSAKDIHNKPLIEKLKRYSRTADGMPDRLVLELTESSMMADKEQARTMMAELIDCGYLFSLDDFGTGFSSLSLLQDLPLAQIKIDRSFVMNIDHNRANNNIVDSVVYLAKKLDFTVVAEGVETQLAVAKLVSMQCDYSQGYFFSKPIPLVDFIDYIGEHNQSPISA